MKTHKELMKTHKELKIVALKTAKTLINIRKAVMDTTFGHAIVEVQEDKEIDVYDVKGSGQAMHTEEICDIVKACTILNFYIRYDCTREQYQYHIF